MRLTKARVSRRLTLLLAGTVSCAAPAEFKPDAIDEATGGSGEPLQNSGGDDVQGTGGDAATAGAMSAGSAEGDAGGGGAVHGVDGSAGSKSGVCPTPEEDIFSFFLTSREALVALAGNENGFGGALGGLKGADLICQTIAESVSECQKYRVWRAFLSTSTEDAIDRIGPGPWYDRLGRLLANNLQELLNDRPLYADPAIRDDLPNEFGVPNHNPTAAPGGEVDNHEILTGSGRDGRKYYQDASGSGGLGTACGAGESWSIQAATCWDWTSDLPQGCPRVGHSWPAQMSGVNWISVWNEGGCAPGGVLNNTTAMGGPDGTRRVGSAGGYGGFYCFGLLGAG